ncbi:MAG: Mut7-C RNAse domain-containing protein [Chloroflexota bacterium]|jgi:uncharacterized protein with PIN domain
MARLVANINMQQITVTFHGRLVDYLVLDGQTAEIAYTLNGPTAVKHAIEALGVPHTEVECILANNRSVGFSYILRESDHIGIYPVIPAGALNPVRLRPPLPAPVRFVADNHLGRLVTYLRLLGFDVLHAKYMDDAQLAEFSAQQGRILLSRDRRLLMRRIVIHGYCLQSRDPLQQLESVLDRFDLYQDIRPWKRCLRCNGLLRPVPKEEILQRLEPKTKKYYHEFHMCQECQQIYWKGSHYEPLHDLVREILATRPPDPDDSQGKGIG